MSPHPFDPISFVFGALFMVTGIAALGTWLDIRHLDADTSWFLPVALVVLGLGLLSSAVNRRALGDDGSGAGSRSTASDTVDRDPDHQTDQADSPSNPSAWPV